MTIFQSVLDAKDWSHLTESQKQSLFSLIKAHDALFILSENELGRIDAPPVHINVADPTPVRGPTHRYPEKAKTDNH